MDGIADAARTGERAGQRLAYPQKEPFTPSMLSPSDTAIVFVLALLLFGPEQLPRIARQLGEAMRHMQNTTQTFMNEMERAARASEHTPPRPPTREEQSPTQETTSAEQEIPTETTTAPPEAPTA